MKYSLLIFIYTLIGCSFYSFKGSIPAHINSIYISPVENQTIEGELSNIIKVQLDESLIRENILKLLSSDIADSQIDVSLVSFTDRPYSYDLRNVSEGYETVNEYRVTIRAKVVWYDLTNNEILFEEEVSGWAAYDPGVDDIGSDGIDNDSDTYIDSDDDDEFGLPRESAISIASKKVSDSIINNIVSTW